MNAAMALDRQLERGLSVEVILISRNNFFLFTPPPGRRSPPLWWSRVTRAIRRGAGVNDVSDGLTRDGMVKE